MERFRESRQKSKQNQNKKTKVHIFIFKKVIMAPTGETVFRRGEFWKLVVEEGLAAKCKNDPIPWQSVIDKVSKSEIVMAVIFQVKPAPKK